MICCDTANQSFPAIDKSNRMIELADDTFQPTAWKP
jgi:hypothetical protein